jgi:hypothetical protein
VARPALVVMPERLANTGPFQSIKELIGSGPFRFVAPERAAAIASVCTSRRREICHPTGHARHFVASQVRTAVGKSLRSLGDPLLSMVQTVHHRKVILADGL